MLLYKRGCYVYHPSSYRFDYVNQTGKKQRDMMACKTNIWVNKHGKLA